MHNTNIKIVSAQTMSWRVKPSLGLIQNRFRWTKWNASLNQTSVTSITVCTFKILHNNLSQQTTTKLLLKWLNLLIFHSLHFLVPVEMVQFLYLSFLLYFQGTGLTYCHSNAK